MCENIGNPPFHVDDYLELVEVAGVLIHDIISMDPMIYAHPSFEDVVYHDVFEVLQQQLHTVFDYDIEQQIHSAITNASKIYHTSISPRRSYDPTFVRRKPVIEKMKSKIQYLKNVPQPDQRTDEWYHFRHRYLTASSLWKAFGTQRAQNELIYNKCRPIDVEKYKSVNTESPMHWGQKYEDVSIQWYSNKYTTTVSEFGCIPHPSISYLAASPDGINTDEKSDLYGRMLEVKNIVNREITGIPKSDYWIQMQLQMEVCDLNECDFLETRFKEYEHSKAFHADGDFSKTKDGRPKGVIMMFNRDGVPLYEYMPYGVTEDEFIKWENSMFEKHSAITWVRNDYWYLDEVSCVLVLRNKMWFKHASSILCELWTVIEYDREHGYEHRAPNRKSKPPKKIPVPSNCLIDISLSPGI